MNKFKTSHFFILFLIVNMTLLFGCSSNNSIVGKWQESSGATMQFFKDGTVTSSGLLSSTGNYTFLDKTHIKIELAGFWSIAGPQVYEFSVTSTKLLLTDNNGTTKSLTKLK